MEELKFFATKDDRIVIAARPDTGAAIIFRPNANKWGFSPQDYDQLTRGDEAMPISEEKAQSIYQNNIPDSALLDEIDLYSG